MNSIEGVVIDGLCAGCGTCVGVCPSNAVRMRNSDGILLPEINKKACTACGLCLECCPGYSVNFSELETAIFDGQAEDPHLGRYLKCYRGHSADDGIRRDSSSGGIATQLLVFALEKGLINGVLVVGAQSGNPLGFTPYIAKSRKEILSASTSKYCPTATGEALKQILKENGKFAVVGLPCQIHGIRKAEEAIGTLKKRIILHIGLVCFHTVNFHGTETLLKKFSLSPESVKSIKYRGRGWPGSMTITTKTDSAVTIPYVGAWRAYGPLFSSFFFTPRRCLMCPDETNELADLSLGDAWLPELRKEKRGESIMISRTKSGEELLQLAHRAGVISMVPLNRDEVEAAQASPLKFKKRDFETRLAMIQRRKMRVPSFSPKPRVSRSLFSYARTLFVLFNVERSEEKTSRRLLAGIPFPLLRLYYGIYKMLCMA